MELFEKSSIRGILAESGSSVPAFPVILGYSIWAYHKYTGIPAHKIMKDGKKHAAAQLYIAKEYNLPIVTSFTDLNIVGEALGATLTYMPDVVPMHETPAVQTASDIEALEPANPLKDGRMPQIIETCKIFTEKFKDPDHLLVAGVEGPITAAGSTFGMENLMRNMIKSPDLVHKVLKVATDSIIDFLNVQMEQGLDMVALSDPSASCTCISPEFFDKYAFPYLKKIIRKVNSLAFLVHICGETLNLMKSLTKIPKILAISVDKIDMKEAKKIIGKKFISLMGNVPTEVLRYGTPQQVDEMARKCIHDVAKGGKFILSSACDISPGTPPVNIRTLIDAGIKYGTFPLKF